MTTLARNWVNWRRVHGLVLLVTVALLAPWATLAGAQAPDAVAADSVSVVELERLAATLENEAERTAFLARLRALIAAQRSDGKADGVDGGPPALGALAQRLREEGGPFAGTIEALSRFPELGDWLVRQGTNPEARDAWFRIGVELAGVLLAAWLAARIIAWPLAGPGPPSNGGSRGNRGCGRAMPSSARCWRPCRWPASPPSSCSGRS